jgi:tetratricopeptide (TPR) repeat protein
VIEVDHAGPFDRFRKDGMMRLSPVVLAMLLTPLLALAIAAVAQARSTNELRAQALQFYDAGRFREAIALLDQVLQKHPRDLEALVKRGNCYLRSDQPARALPDFDRARTINPTYPGAYTGRGIALLMLNQVEEALATFQDSVRVWNSAADSGQFYNPAGLPFLFPVPNASGSLSPRKTREIQRGHATAYAGLGQSYHRLGEDEQALVAYDQSIKIFPGDPNFHVGRGDCQSALGNLEAALTDYNEAIRLAPNFSRAYASRGHLLEALKRNDEALADFDRALQLDPNFVHVHRLRGALLSRMGRNDRAITDAEAATRLYPDDAGAHKDRGGILVRMGKYQEALAELNRAIELNPEHATAYMNRGAAYNSLGQYEKAIEDLNRAIDLDPTLPGAHSNIGLAYYMIAQYDRAIEELSEAVKLAPNNAIVHLNRGNVFARIGLAEQAASDYAIADRINPTLMASYGGPAKLLEEMGRNGLAIREDRTRIGPDQEELKRLLDIGHARRARGEWAGAIAAYSQVIERDPNRADVHIARGWARLCSETPGAEIDASAYLNLKGWRDRFSPYMALLGFLGARDARHEADAQRFLDQAIAQSSPDAWPLPVLRFLRHDINTKSLLEKAETSTQQAEARTFIALELIHRGERLKALEHLRWVRDQGASNSIATDLARATLERLESPGSTSRGPLDRPRS